LIEPVQGESGITIASAEYLIGLRGLCDERNMLLLFDEVQAGHFRTGKFQSWQRIVASASGRCLEKDHRQDADATFVPDAVSMAKSLGGGFPMGAFWVRDRHADLLGPGTHGTTFGGTPLGCAVALKIFEVIERDRLADNARTTGEFLILELQRLVKAFPNVLKSVRGFGFIIGLELVEKEKIRAFAASDKTASIQFVNRLHAAGSLSIPSGSQVIRLLPPLNLTRGEAAEGIAIIEGVVKGLS